MSDDQPVLLEVTDGVATVTLHRPERRNAWTVGMQAGYFGALQTCWEDPEVRAIVVTGAGGSFCPGADTAALTTYTETGTTNPLADEIEQPEWFPSTVPKPLVAAIEGPCAGVGLAQALMCDLRVAAPTARFSTAFARRGLPAMHGAEWLLERIVGAGVAHDLLLTGRTFDGAEAARHGVVTETADDPLARATAIARDLADHCSPQSMAQIKGRLWTTRERTLATAVAETDAIVDDFLASADFREGVASFMERRPPQFSGLEGPTRPATS
ncbi:enoyl-CoA hydratase/isomerase family protein [Aeromicrobium marinum DSM 15272]|uniref:Enoyl-CoA hydratase/isomerase family protein n=1 Tax=Aeromicrobium marinum DSM 15272 TaxID=585531 RepID=E2S809_9ACTN|nr:enoyl-CoA hydratase-related protein [Aeromicrobium marinum]EFQ84825.1 enoyl-CoA hydratase/isomerase family protein [Aeromicrobium marinum DSM 15272]